MKKRIILLILCAILFVGTLSACGEKDNTVNSVSTNTYVPDSIPGFENISKEDLLFYNTQTKVVYYIFFNNNMGYKGYGFMSPYISENGNFCRYVDGKIVEIQK